METTTKKNVSELSKKQILKTLFISTFNISAFTIGGGYVIVPLLQEKFANELGWIDEEEMLNFVAIGQSSPGPIAVNTSILIGYKMAGILGAVIATFGTVLPPLLIISIVSVFYEKLKDNRVFNIMLKGMQAGVAAIIVNTVIGMANNIIKRRSVFYNAIMILVFILVFFANINVVYIILGCIGGALLNTLIVSKKYPPTNVYKEVDAEGNMEETSAVHTDVTHDGKKDNSIDIEKDNNVDTKNENKVDTENENIMDTENKHIPESEKDSILDTEKNSIVDTEKDNSIDIEKDMNADIEKDNMADSKKDKNNDSHKED